MSEFLKWDNYLQPYALVTNGTIQKPAITLEADAEGVKDARSLLP